MAVTLADAVVYFKGDDKQLASDLNQAESKTKSWASSLGSMAQGALMGVGMAAFDMVAGVAQKAVAFVGDSISAASDMNETVSKVNTLFGDSATQLMQWSQTSVQAFGLSQVAALDAAGSIGNMFMQLGAGSDQAASVSQDMVQMAADIASFHNVAGGTPQVLDAMTAAFRGEYDTVQQFIPTINAAAVELKALEMTHKESAKELTNLDKALAVEAILLEDAGAAAGDFARTSGGLANQQRILDAEMENLKATVGQALLPVMLSLTTMLNNLVQAVLPPLTDFITNRVVPVMSNFGAMFGTLQAWFGKFSASLDVDVSGPLAYWKEWVDSNLPRIQTIFENVLGAIQAFWTEWGDEIMAVVGKVFDTAVTIIDTAMRTIGDLITLALQLMTGDWEGAATTLEGIVTRIWDTMVTVTTNQVGALVSIFTSVDWGAIGTSILQGIADGITNSISVITEAAKNAAESAYEAAKSWLGISSPSKKTEEEIGVPFVEGIGKGIESSMRDLSGTINLGLGNMMSGFNTNGGGHFVINQTFNGQADAQTVSDASENGVLRAQRNLGYR